jgi:superfamily II DNA or RNA helicase
VAAVSKAYARGESRTTVVSACGTGKTLTAAAAAHQLAASRVLVAVPTLALLVQTITRWREAGRRGVMLGVSSMTQWQSGLSVQQALMTSDDQRVVHEAGRAGPLTVFTTYSSLSVIERAHRCGVPAWDLIVIDEAHRTCAGADTGWGVIHDNQAIPARLRLYMTATPRIWDVRQPQDYADWMQAPPTATMDRRDIFGPTVYRLGMSKAIEAGLAADYRVAMPVVRDSDLHSILTGSPELSAHHNGLRAAALQIAVLRAIRDHGLRRVLVFHNRTAAAQAFAATLPGTAKELGIPPVWSRSIDHTQTMAERRHLLRAFETAPGAAVLSNVRVLNEGVDSPDIDAVVFAAPRRSAVAAIQAIGRALRQQPGAGKKATLVLPVYLPGDTPVHHVLQHSAFAPLWTILQALRAHDDTFLDRVAMPTRPTASGRHASSGYYHPPERAAEIFLALGLEIILPSIGNFREGVAAARRYLRVYGHVDVPPDYTDTQHFALGEWIALVRVRHTAGQLDAHHIRTLDTLGMVWATPAGEFARMLPVARAYADEHGHLAAPIDADIGGHKLGRWLSDCRLQARKGRLTSAQHQQLADLDPWWNPDWPLTWRRTYATAQAHFAGGGQYLPNSHVTDDGVPLGQWLSRQRNQFARLHPQQARLVLDLHITPSADSLYKGTIDTDRGWEFREHLYAACQYLAREGHLHVPVLHTEQYLGRTPVRLGRWLSELRRHPNRMNSPEREALSGLTVAATALPGRRKAPGPAADPRKGSATWPWPDRPAERRQEVPDAPVRFSLRPGRTAAFAAPLRAPGMYLDGHGRLRVPPPPSGHGATAVPLGAWLHHARSRPAPLGAVKRARTDRLHSAWARALDQQRLR